ncbi:unnamed protein product [Rotaria socialis]|nr:unnamed protein product [Rotaria socialis]
MDVDTNEKIIMIDLCTPNVDIKDEVSTPDSEKMMITKKPLIERFPNLGNRLPLLPCYPTKDKYAHGDPLLPNISPQRLTRTELERRHLGTFKSEFDFITNGSTIPSFLYEKYQMFYVDLLERLKVDMAVLDYNYLRLNNYMKLLMFERMRIFNISLDNISKIDEKEYPLALEFFLQFDVNMFYMKTCSLRYARPRTLNEGLFCLQEPEARYELSACGNCALCYPQYDRRYRVKKSIVDFSQAHQHTFLNGYHAILNCSASCHTRNIIYALTCPCGNVDYIGETMYSLHDRLIKHREHGNRVMVEFLIGQENVVRDLPRGKSNELSAKDHMKLYQHSVRCTVAMQIFLDANQQYWRFVPMTIEESERPEQRSVQGISFTDELTWNLRQMEDCTKYVESVPKPSTGYIFSNRQVGLQLSYFNKKRDKDLPNQDIDLYNATIVAVLPETCSEMLRLTVESLFITHAETNLNTIGNILNKNSTGNNHPINNPWLIRGDEWYQGLLRRPQPKIKT